MKNVRWVGRIAVVAPYWAFWEASAGGESLRIDRERLLAEAGASLAGAGLDIGWSGLVDSTDTGRAMAEAITAAGVDALVVVQSMAVPPAYLAAGLDLVPDLPLVIWGLQRAFALDPGFDQSDITSLGATVGVPMLTNVLHRSGRAHVIEVGPLEPSIVARVGRTAHVAAVAGSVRRARLGRIGRPMDGYLNVDVDDEDLLGAIGVTVVSVPPTAVADRYRSVTSSPTGEAAAFDVAADLDTLERTFRLAAALEELDRDLELDAGAMNCHVDDIRFADDPGITPCFALGRETSRGIPWTCSGDVITAVAMLVARRLGGASLYHEIEAIDFATGELAIANSGEHDLGWCPTDQRPRLIPNPWFESDRLTGGCAWFELPAGPASLVGFTPHAEEPSGFRFIVAEGEITDRSFPNSPTVGGAFRFGGSSPVGEVWTQWADTGVNHHSALSPGHLGDEVAAVARHLGVGVARVG